MDHVVVLFLIFWGVAILFSSLSVPFYTPANHAQNSNFCFFFFFDSSHPNRYEVVHCIPFWILSRDATSCWDPDY